MTDITKLAVEDLIEKPLKDLLVLQDKLNVAVERKKSTEKVDFAKHLRELAKANGFELEDLASIKVKKVRKARQDAGKPMQPKYRNPANESETWSGKGPLPKWLKAYVEAGKNKEEFLI